MSPELEAQYERAIRNGDRNVDQTRGVELRGQREILRALERIEALTRRMVEPPPRDVEVVLGAVRAGLNLSAEGRADLAPGAPPSSVAGAAQVAPQKRRRARNGA